MVYWRGGRMTIPRLLEINLELIEELKIMINNLEERVEALEKDAADG